MAKKANNTSEKKNFFERIKIWFRGITSELKKVVWPSKKQLIKNTAAVLVIVVFAVVLIWGLDQITTTILNVTGFYEVKEVQTETQPEIAATEAATDEPTEAEADAATVTESETPENKG